MKISCGIIGLPNVGKSTLFKVLTKIPVKIANFPFCTIQPNIAVVKIPEFRLYELNRIVHTHKIVHEIIEFTDVAGLIEGAAHGIGLGPNILNHVQFIKIFCHVIRCFDDDNICHIKNNIDPCRDINIINTELILFDIDKCEKYISFIKKNYKTQYTSINHDQQLYILKKCLDQLYEGILLRSIQWSLIEKQNIQKFNFLTFKPVIYIANINKQSESNIYLQQLQKLTSNQNYAPIVSYCLENSNTKLVLECKNTYSILFNSIIEHVISLLQLNTFFTVNSKMIRAWTCVKGDTAFNVSDKVHSDFKKGFIRVQVIKFSDFIENKGEIGGKKHGKVRNESKIYSVEDGDILKFLFRI
ncbi:GTP-dependent nucleic acid-binding protein engD [Candidatus Blochmanniella vafra str. BVAF]|uniref:GTP-dependent nucleic acid-binding protein engD n=1 Tax=Blochmanniella vafra (strain BVAF) TaxID=859654 RepID=E8Q6Z3_BLOVB|nr:redox-regulated ATPase YchF [Candidatus Blochmannia vafer]ADV33740.1 GTP-dependent nucleic acid-binding protein engD [Candidatus Blochmannia vafer str. BVAF]